MVTQSCVVTKDPSAMKIRLRFVNLFLVLLGLHDRFVT